MSTEDDKKIYRSVGKSTERPINKVFRAVGNRLRKYVYWEMVCEKPPGHFAL